MTYVLSLDQGTTSSRAIVLDHGGNIISVDQKEFRQIFPQPGWVEHDPEDIWSTQSSVATSALSKANLGASDITAIGITNQRETTIIWDRATGEPIHNGIVWQDRRTAATCDQLRADGHAEIFRQKTGLVLDAYFSGTKIAWILDNLPGARSRAERGELAFGTVDCWLAYKLTGKHLTDTSNACRTLAFDIHTCQWDDELLGILNVPREVLPEVHPSSQIYGEVNGLPALKGVPLAGIAGDQQAATMGQICTEVGLAKNTYGTGCFLLLNTGTDPRTSHNNLITTVAWTRDDVTTYALEGSVFIGGAIVQWLRDGLGIIKNAPEVNDLASSVKDTGGVYLVPALTGLGAPHWDQYARGAIVGITRGTTAAHIARAALEGIAFEVADLVHAMNDDASVPINELRVDGGAAASDLLMQFQADILQIPIVRPTVLETTALGAAYLAGLATGYWSSIEDIRSNWQVERRFEPQMSADQSARMMERWHDAVERSKGWDK
jgi:glycerol kinase